MNIESELFNNISRLNFSQADRIIEESPRLQQILRSKRLSDFLQEGVSEEDANEIVNYLLLHGLIITWDDFLTLTDMEFFNIATMLIETGQINIYDENVWHYVPISEVSFKTLEFILMMGANPNLLDKYDVPLLLQTVRVNNLPAFHLLLEYGASLKVRYDYSPILYEIILDGSYEILHHLIKLFEKDSKKKEDFKNTITSVSGLINVLFNNKNYLLSSQEKVEILEMLLQLIKKEEDIENELLNSLMFICGKLMKDQYELDFIERLLRLVSPVKIRNYTENNKNLIVNISPQNKFKSQLFKLLVKYGAYEKYITSYGNSALFIFADDDEIFWMLSKSLEEFPTEMRIAGNTINLVEHLAEIENSSEKIIFLAEKGININGVDNNGEPLRKALEKGLIENADTLVKLGSIMPILDSPLTFLMYLIRAGPLKSVRFLLTLGVDVNVSLPVSGKDAMWEVINLGRGVEYAELLFSKGYILTDKVEEFCTTSRNIKASLFIYLVEKGLNLNRCLAPVLNSLIRRRDTKGIQLLFDRGLLKNYNITRLIPIMNAPELDYLNNIKRDLEGKIAQFIGEVENWRILYGEKILKLIEEKEEELRQRPMTSEEKVALKKEINGEVTDFDSGMLTQFILTSKFRKDFVANLRKLKMNENE